MTRITPNLLEHTKPVRFYRGYSSDNPIILKAGLDNAGLKREAFVLR